VDETVSRRALHFPQGSPAVYLKHKKNNPQNLSSSCQNNYVIGEAIKNNVGNTGRQLLSDGFATHFLQLCVLAALKIT